MYSRRSLTCVPAMIYRHRSRLSRYQEGLLCGDEVVSSKKPSFTKTSAKNKDTVKSLGESKLNSFYPRISPDDPIICEALKMARGLGGTSHGQLSHNRTVVLEGSRLIRDTLRSGGQLLYLFFSSRDLLEEIHELGNTSNVYYVPYKTLKQWSSVKTPSGILAICRIPDQVNPEQERDSTTSTWKPLPTILILDNIRDPGNLGSLLRTAAGFGLPSVLISKGTVDIWNEKVVRSGMSAHFRIPIYPGLDWSAIGRLFTHPGLNTSAVQSTSIWPKVFVADIATKATDQMIAARFSTNTQESYSPSSDTAEYESDQDETDVRQQQQPIELDSTGSAFRLPLSTLPHFAVNYFPQSPDSSVSDRRVALVVGGEAHGLSSEAYHLAHLTGGSRIFVPTAPGTESLNVLSAASIILGEMQRQYLAM